MRLKRTLIASLSVVFFLTSVALRFINNANAGISVWSPGHVTALDADGNEFSCAIVSNKVYCWGNSNTYGQLATGDNTTVSLIPREITDTNGVLVGKQLTLLAIAQTGTVCVVASNVPYCWGRGNYGALGDNTTSNRYYPSAVTTSGVLSGKTITKMAAGDGHVCVVASGAAYCWGANGQGRLGDNSTTQRNTPVAVNTSGALSGKTVTDIGAGTASTCALASSAMYCWGDDANGQLGNDASLTESHVPVAVDTSGVLSGKNITNMATGFKQTCVIADDSKAYCWGGNPEGSVGNNTQTDQPTPVAVTASGALSGKTLTNVYAGTGRTCVTDTNKDAYCWGSGPVGEGSSSAKLTPVAVTVSSVMNGMDIVMISPGWGGNCFVNSLERIYCTAISSGSGQLGNNTTNASSPAVEVLFSSTFNAPNYRLYANADSATPGTALAAINTPATFTTYSQAFRVRTGIKATTQLASVTAGASYACGLTDGKVYCWGYNSNGQLGNNSTTESHVPVAVDTSGVLSGKPVSSVSAGSTHACAIASDGQVYCWGSNGNGQLGNNSTTESHVPVAVDTTGVLSGKTVVAVSAGENYTCAFASDNNAYCWGYNNHGQLGNNSTTESHVPVAVDTSGALSGLLVFAVSAGTTQTCAIASDKNAYCWGYNSNGQLGDNTTTESHVPVAVSTSGVLSGKTIQTITAGAAYNCAVASDNNAYCWGYNSNGQLGNNSTTESHVAVAVDTSGVLSGKTVLSVNAGNTQTCAIASDNNAYCWGYNNNGQLGDNTTTESHVPVAVNTSGVLSGKTISHVSAGDNFNCALASDRLIDCWGYNSNGQLGNDSTSESHVAVAVIVDGYVPGADINPNDNTYKLQFAQKTVSTCSTQTGYADVTGSTAIAFNTNPSVSNGATITTNSNDPVPTSSSVAERYISASGTFTNPVTITGGKTGLWDFSLKDNSNAYSTSYCLRMTYGDGTAIEGAVQYPEIQTVAKINSSASPFRFYQNANSATPGSPLGLTNEPVALTSPNQAFRLRFGLTGGASFSKITSGDRHSCVIASDNNVYCWGKNTNGQLGNNTTTIGYIPVAVSTSGVLSGKTVTAIAAGSGHTCAIASDNNAYCWGYDGNGQLGNNSTTESHVPVAVSTTGVLSGKTVLSIAAGANHTCVVASDNNVYCWGYNDHGQLGNNSTAQSLVPVAVDTSGVLSGKTILSVATGWANTCVVASDNNAYCWGYNDHGQLGNNSTSDTHVPVAVDTSGVLSGKTVLKVAPGGRHTCAIASDNKAYCWGGNWNGQLGDNTGSESHVPVAVYTSGVLSGKTILSMTSSTMVDHTCVVASDNNAYCWGYNGFGQLGDNSTSTRFAPVAVYTSGVLSGLTVSAVSAGSYNTCSIASDSQAYCWGADDTAQLGNDSTGDTKVPVKVVYYYSGIRSSVSGKAVYSVSTGQGLTCMIASDYLGYCTGRGANGILGNNSNIDVKTPVAVSTSGVLSGKTLLSITTHYTHTCAIASDNNAYCWGYGWPGQLGNNSNGDAWTPVAVSTSGALSGKTVRSIGVGNSYTCAIASDNNAYCWGQGGSLGDNVGSSTMVPGAVYTSGVLSGKTLQSLSVGESHSCVIASDNNAYCWGGGGSGQLGNSANSNSLVPVAVTTSGVLSGKTILSISAGYYHTCVIASDNKAYCWGDNWNGQLGNNTNHNSSNVPVAVNTAGVLSGKNLVSISAGNAYTCAIDTAGVAYCWGANASGQLGNNSTTDSSVPVAVDTSMYSGKTILSVSTTYDHSCAVSSDNQLYCWGSDTTGQFGDNTNIDSSLIPVRGFLKQYVSIGQSIGAGANGYTLQYAEKTVSTCTAQSGFADVTGATPIAFNTNGSVSNGASISTTSNDPLASGQTTAQTYISASGIFTTTNTTAFGTMSMWDFSLKDNGATYGKTYCLRVAYSDGTALPDQVVLPEVSITSGTLSVSFVNSMNVPVASPLVPFGSINVATSAQNSTATLGVSSQKLRVYNDVATNGWSVSLAATSGTTAYWNRTDSLAKYDFNDASGAVDGADADSLGGQLTLTPGAGTIASSTACSTSGVSKGSTASFSEGVTDSITLMSANSSAAMGCNYELTGVGLSEAVPLGQPAGSYTIDMTATVVAL